MTEAGFFSPQISRHCWTVWRRNWEVFFKTYTVNFLPPVLEPVLYLLAIGYGLVSPHGSPADHGAGGGSACEG